MRQPLWPAPTHHGQTPPIFNINLHQSSSSATCSTRVLRLHSLAKLADAASDGQHTGTVSNTCSAALIMNNWQPVGTRCGARRCTLQRGVRHCTAPRPARAWGSPSQPASRGACGAGGGACALRVDQIARGDRCGWELLAYVLREVRPVVAPAIRLVDVGRGWKVEARAAVKVAQQQDADVVRRCRPLSRAVRAETLQAEARE